MKGDFKKNSIGLLIIMSVIYVTWWISSPLNEGINLSNSAYWYGGGWSSRKVDYCPDWEFTNSRYDGECWVDPDLEEEDDDEDDNNEGTGSLDDNNDDDNNEGTWSLDNNDDDDNDDDDDEGLTDEEEEENQEEMKDIKEKLTAFNPKLAKLAEMFKKRYDEIKTIDPQWAKDLLDKYNRLSSAILAWDKEKLKEAIIAFKAALVKNNETLKAKLEEKKKEKEAFVADKKVKIVTPEFKDEKIQSKVEKLNEKISKFIDDKVAPENVDKVREAYNKFIESIKEYIDFSRDNRDDRVWRAELRQKIRDAHSNYVNVLRGSRK